jgi:hypothetical protein
MRTWTFKL